MHSGHDFEANGTSKQRAEKLSIEYGGEGKDVGSRPLLIRRNKRRRQITIGDIAPYLLCELTTRSTKCQKPRPPDPNLHDERARG